MAITVTKQPPEPPPDVYTISGLSVEQVDVIRELVRVASGRHTGEIHTALLHARGFASPTVRIFRNSSQLGANQLMVAKE
jgi:hypothetical protein